MSVELWFAFVAASTVMLVIPMPTMLTVISYSLAHGKSAKMPLVTAVALGDSTALVFSLLGLGALLATLAVWFTAVKWIAGLYLLFPGIKLLRAGFSPIEIATPNAPGSRWRLFANTWLVKQVFVFGGSTKYLCHPIRWRTVMQSYRPTSNEAINLDI